jgi:hypothetical protein
MVLFVTGLKLVMMETLTRPMPVPCVVRLLVAVTEFAVVI